MYSNYLLVRIGNFAAVVVRYPETIRGRDVVNCSTLTDGTAPFFLMAALQRSFYVHSNFLVAKRRQVSLELKKTTPYNLETAEKDNGCLSICCY